MCVAVTEQIRAPGCIWMETGQYACRQSHFGDRNDCHRNGVLTLHKEKDIRENMRWERGRRRAWWVMGNHERTGIDDVWNIGCSSCVFILHQGKTVGPAEMTEHTRPVTSNTDHGLCKQQVIGVCVCVCVCVCVSVRLSVCYPWFMLNRYTTANLAGREGECLCAAISPWCVCLLIAKNVAFSEVSIHLITPVWPSVKYKRLSLISEHLLCRILLQTNSVMLWTLWRLWWMQKMMGEIFFFSSLHASEHFWLILWFCTVVSELFLGTLTYWLGQTKGINFTKPWQSWLPLY